MKQTLFLLLAVTLAAGCDTFDNFVAEVDDPIDTILDDQLNQPSQIEFLINGVQARFSSTHDNGTLLADLLSDAAVFGRNSDATFPTYQQIDLGDILFVNNSVDTFYGLLGEYRLLADQLVQRADIIESRQADFPEEYDQDDVDLARYVGYLNGGNARFLYGAYIGANPLQGGSAIGEIVDGASPFVPSAALYDSTLARYDQALEAVSATADPAYNTRLINSLKARVALYSGDFDQAGTLAAQGLEEGDAPYQSEHNIQSQNLWFNNAYKTSGGDGRLQVAVAERFRTYLREDSAEVNRVPVNAIVIADTFVIAPGTTDTTFYEIGDILDDPTLLGTTASEPFQDVYPSRFSPITFMSWEETALMRAEVAVRNGDEGTALSLVNSVRGDDLEDLDSVDLQIIATERDKELFGQGQRLVDQRRLDVVDWHLDDNTAIGTTWRYLPITNQERVNNTCVPLLKGGEVNTGAGCDL